MTFCQRKDQAARLRAIPLEAVLPLCGGQPDPYDKRKWHTPVGTLSLTGAKFMNWKSATGGGGAIDLVIHLNHLDFKAAVDWLADHFPGVAPAQSLGSAPKSDLHLPPPDASKLERVKDYLIHQRAIARALLTPLIQSATLYADNRANAVFLMLAKQHRPVGAELRGTTPTSWRGLAPGSQKDSGCFAMPAYSFDGAMPAGSPVILCESAIDAISCFALHPQYICLSTAGVRPNPRWLTPLLAQGCEIWCGFDADAAGDDMARAMIALHPSIKRLRPLQHDWNDQLRVHA